MGGGGIGYVNAPSTSTGVKEGIAAIVGGPIQGNGSRGSVPWTTSLYMVRFNVYFEHSIFRGRKGDDLKGSYGLVGVNPPSPGWGSSGRN